MKFKGFKFKKATSTNDFAINLIKKKKKQAGYVYAEIQTKGKGTYGKGWVSKKGNLFYSIFFPLKKNFPPFNEFSIINPVIISNIIKHFCKRQTIQLKFPNDIFVNGKKICGILQEHIIFNKKKFLIVGIGINIVSSPKVESNYGTTNILFETNKKPKIKEIMNLITSSYKDFFINLSSYNFKNFKKKAELLVL